MAASGKTGGYNCEFIDVVPADFLCESCCLVAREPSLTVCCGKHYCHTCISHLLRDSKPCPGCEAVPFSAILDKNYQRKTLALRVHCTMKDCGCQWTGQLKQHDAHLDVETGDCEYVDIECPEKCGQQIQKCQLTTHIANECPERDFVCMYCGFKATYDIISNEHWPECQNCPVPCPNRCDIGAVERNILEDHLSMCSLQVVECDFSYAGCNKKLQRQDMEKHVEESTREHLALMAAASVRMSREFEKKLQEQRDEFQGYLEQKEKKTAELLKLKDREIKAVEERLEQSVRQNEHLQEVFQEQLQERDGKFHGEVQIQQQHIEALRDQITQWEEKEKESAAKLTDVHQQLQLKTQQIKDLEKDMKFLTVTVGGSLFPKSFIVSKFQKKKEYDSFCQSPGMYTHSCGYKFFINVAPNGWREGVGTHLAVWLWAMPGEFDKHLPWPAKFTITVQLLNQFGDFGHSTVTKEFQWNCPTGQLPVASFSDTFIPHAGLGPNVNGTCYLTGDCLHFKILEVRPY